MLGLGKGAREGSSFFGTLLLQMELDLSGCSSVARSPFLEYIIACIEGLQSSEHLPSSEGPCWEMGLLLGYETQLKLMPVSLAFTQLILIYLQGMDLALVLFSLLGHVFAFND